MFCYIFSCLFWGFLALNYQVEGTARNGGFRRVGTAGESLNLTPFLTEPQAGTVKKAEDLELPEPCGEQADREQEARPLGWDPPRTQALTDPQILRPSWNQDWGGNIYLSSLGWDKVPCTRELKKELMNPRKQTQILLLTSQAEVVEAENLAHYVAEKRQIRQQRSPFWEEKIMEAAQGFQETLQEWWEGIHISPRRQRGRYHP